MPLSDNMKRIIAVAKWRVAERLLQSDGRLPGVNLIHLARLEVARIQTSRLIERLSRRRPNE